MNRLATPLLLLVLLTGCNILGPSAEKVLTMEVAHYRVACMAMIPTQCMLVREAGSQEWTNFFGEIIGFTYEPGYAWRLRVARRELRNPPADGSSFEYRLLEVLEKVAVE
jgi:hypothetical protein